ncbi:hypothetical protein Bca52824_017051 [Brassica carinata]|uniref:3-beta hydroxysteroid dehydrogenase/isomerase domain-containing protein n=1 Tax=Brassica carinata TaxID=52824 RepID=A0A8X8AUZ4_BRACI|nr:hypothetical protein Bca52824_017051 [Brassica carinata]
METGDCRRGGQNEKKMAHLRVLQELGELRIFKAKKTSNRENLTDEGSFSLPVSGSEYVFHVATPISFASQDPEKDMINPAIQGEINVLKSCLNSNSAKRVIYTSSAAAVSINNLSGPGLVMTEENWSDIDFRRKEKPFNWFTYFMSLLFLGLPYLKGVSRKGSLYICEENKIDLVTLVPALIAGNSLLSDPPSSLSLSMSITKIQKLSGSISFIRDRPSSCTSVSCGERNSFCRCICCSHNTNVPEIADFLRQRYPHYNVISQFEECLSSAKLTLSSEKLTNEGFRFEYGMKEMYDEMMEYFETNPWA